MRAAAAPICFTGRTRRRASNTLRPTPTARNAASSSAVRQIFPRTGVNAALSLLDEHLPADRLDGRPGAQHLLSAEVAADRRSGRDEASALSPGKSQGRSRKRRCSRDGYAWRRPRRRIRTSRDRLPDKVLNDAEIESLADDSIPCCDIPSGEPTTTVVSLTATSIDLAPGWDRSRGAYTGPK